MNGNKIQLRYNSKSKCIWCTLNSEICKKPNLTPQEILDKARQKILNLQKQNEIYFFEIYEDKLLKVWNNLKSLNDSEDKKHVNVIIAQGSPKLEGFKILKPKGTDALINISFEVSKEILKNWKIEWLEVYINKALKKLQIQSEINPANLQSAIIKGYLQLSKKIPIFSKDSIIKPQNKYKNYYVIFNSKNSEIILVINNINYFESEENYNECIKNLKEAINKIQTKHSLEFKLLKQNIHYNIQVALTREQKLGIGLPVIILAAFGFPKKSKYTSQKQSLLVNTNYANPYNFEFEISPDNMYAKIKSYSEKIYDDYEKGIISTHIKDAIKQAGIKRGVKEELLQEIMQKIAKKEPINGIVVAVGEPPINPEKAFLHIIEEHTQNLYSLDDRRNVGIKTFVVKANQPIAEICYEIKPRPGYDIFGNILQPQINCEIPELKYSDGIEFRKNGKYYALHDGVVSYNEQKQEIVLKKILIYEGDINNLTGNVDFDGPIEVKGNIEGGVQLICGDTLIVHGHIRGAKIYCKKDLIVDGGIILGENGFIKIGGNLTAEFIENSTIYAKNCIKVQKSIISSKITSEEGIEVLGDPGLIAGGNITCHHYIRVSKLGKDRGSKTEINLGINQKINNAIHIRQKRLDNLLNVLKQYKYQASKSKAFANNKYKQQKKLDKIDLTKLPKLEALVEKAKAHLKKAESMPKIITENVYLYVSGLLSSNCLIKICGKNVNLLSDEAATVYYYDSVGGIQKVPCSTFDAKLKASLLKAS